ncbi:MAG TPA: DUF3006 domain-containing protein [Pyrinomonadaceae bacterium]|nr:DUF3006 domain-containing protein [Pyrinomonadaceae bacterium]
MAKEDDRKEHKEESSRTRAVIDRIEDGRIAVLLIGEDGKTRVDVPLSLLPEGASDGDHLNISISLDRNSRTEAEARIRRLQDELREQSGTDGKTDFKL